MPNLTLSFIHLSDIHFGQERGGKLITHEDVRARLIEDVATFFTARQRAGGAPATGIVVTGDIAYGGKKEQYEEAGVFLDNVAKAAGCDKTAVQLAPGNHDIDLEELTHGTRRMLDAIKNEGDAELDRQLQDERDRESLYARFKAYAVFADGYGCPLDAEGGHAGAKDFPIAPGRIIRFVAWNSALLCTGKDSQGKLLLGAKQRTLGLENGVEHVVLSHHPLHWFADHADAKKFLKNRARIFLSGHEHLAEIVVEQVEPNTHFVHLCAGATTPPEGFEYTYNIIDLEWVAVQERLDVIVHPRVWVDSKKAFDADFNRLGGDHSKRCELGCPRFRAAPAAPLVPTVHVAPSPPAADPPQPQPYVIGNLLEGSAVVDDHFARVRLRFFRELSRVQRLTVLVEIGMLPRDLDGFPTMGVERKALERLRGTGKLDELERMIEREVARVPNEGGEDDSSTSGVRKA